MSPVSRRRSTVHLYRDAAGDWRWTFVHWNGDVMADGAQGYSNAGDAEHGARVVCGRRVRIVVGDPRGTR